MSNWGSAESNDSMEWSRRSNSVTQKLQSIQKDIQYLQNILKAVKTGQGDSGRAVERLHSASNNLQTTITAVQELDQFAKRSSGSERMQRADQVKHFERNIATAVESIKKLNVELRSVLDQRKRLSSASSDMSSQVAFATDPSKRSSQLQMYSHNDQIRREQEQTEREMAALADDMVDLEEIFTQLNTHVVGQREMVDNIHDNVETVTEHVKDAEQNLNDAVDYKRAACKKKIIIIVILLVVLVVLFLAIGLPLILHFKN